MRISGLTLLPFWLILLTGFGLNAQNVLVDSTIHLSVDVEANYPAGISDFENYIINNLKNVPDANYKVVVYFTVDQNGNIISIKPRNRAYGVEEKLVELIKNTGRWNPAILKGEKVRSVLELVVNFGSYIINGKKIQLGSPQTEIFTIVDNDASYPGGSTAWRNFIGENLNGRIPIKKGAKPGLYFHPLTNFGYGMEEEVIRVIKKSGKWNAASHQGIKLRVNRKQPVTFSVE